MSLYFALLTVENNKNVLNFCDFSQVFVLPQITTLSYNLLGFFFAMFFLLLIKTRKSVISRKNKKNAREAISNKQQVKRLKVVMVQA